jgi:preprotein translocase subunit SecG
MLLGILLTLLVIVCVLLIAVILMQRSEGGALGMGGGGGGGFLSARGTGDLLTRTTQILGFIFFVLCLAITVVTGRSQGSGSLINQAPIGKIDPSLLKREAPPQQQPAAPAPQSDGFQAPAPAPSLGAPPAPAPAAPASSPFQAPPAR